MQGKKMEKFRGRGLPGAGEEDGKVNLNNTRCTKTNSKELLYMVEDVLVWFGCIKQF